MRQRSLPVVENPVSQAIARASVARDQVMTRDAMEPLEHVEAEVMFPVAVELLTREAARSRRTALWIGAASLGFPLVLTLLLLACGVARELFLP
ncbi:MAG: hypothetical protein QM758_26315 [Armatimonas sp.]